MASIGSNDKSQEALKMEKEILSELKDAAQKIEKISEKEENFLKEVRDGEHSNKVETSIKDTLIFLDEDVEKELSDVETKIQALRDVVGKSRPHADLLEKLSHTLGLMEKEEQRFRSILNKAERHIEDASGPEEVRGIEEKIVEFEETEERNAMHEIEQELKAAENELKKINQKQARRN
jgi:DNA repair exonuclease SbcCD ATPase subunit